MERSQRGAGFEGQIQMTGFDFDGKANFVSTARHLVCRVGLHVAEMGAKCPLDVLAASCLW